ncbi:MAG: hypothetical protein ACRDJY_02640 [Thermoleophilaceae bacterium]
MPRPHHFSSPRAFVRAVAFESRLRSARLQMERGVSRADRSGRPLLVGPWLSEIGFELLYWIPLLRKLLREHGVAPAQVTALSRGGVRSWYAGVADGYTDLLELLTPSELRGAHEHRVTGAGDQKQQQVTGFDRRLWRRAAPERALCVHPLIMYTRLRYYWGGFAGLDEVERRCEFAAIPPAPPPKGLPARYVAVKPYFSDCFPDTPENRAFTTEVLNALAAESDVVVMTTGLELDDHAEPDLPAHPRVHTLGSLVEPARNLEIQTAVVAASTALVATYGGPSYLGPFVGVPSVSFFSRDNHNPAHLAVANLAAEKLDAPAPKLFDARRQGAAADAVTAALSGDTES